MPVTGLANLAIKVTDLEAACAEAIEVAQQIEPDAKAVERYSVGYQAYRKVYPALKGIQG